jgi:hypothetical protein
VEPLWSPVVATGGNQWRIANGAKPLKQAKTVAVGCDQLPEAAHGKEGVDGSSPSEGSAKVQQIRDFSFRLVCATANVRQVWSRLWSFQLYNASVDHRLKPRICRFRTPDADRSGGLGRCVTRRADEVEEAFRARLVAGELRGEIVDVRPRERVDCSYTSGTQAQVLDAR